MLIVAMQILNLSVYSGGNDIAGSRNTIGEENEIDSLIEYIVEIVFNYHDVFPENGAHNENSSHSLCLKHVDFKVFHSFPCVEPLNDFNATVKYMVPVKEDYNYMYFREINPPPPKSLI